MFLLLFPLSAYASIAGVYEVHGYDPEIDREYSGKAIIEKHGKIYNVTWIFPAGNIDVGTAVKAGDSLSISFYEIATNTYGTQLSQIDGKQLQGPWVRFNTNKKGYEKLCKIGNSL